MNFKLISTSLFGLFVFSILYFLYPGLMNFHEQNQLFLFTKDYFADRITTCGGLADYVSEFLVQFFYVPAYGAWIYAIVLCAIQLLTFSTFEDKDGKKYFLSFLPSILIFLYSGNENLLLSFSMSIIFVLLYIKLSQKNLNLSLMLLPLNYWLIGAMCAVNSVFVGYKLIKNKKYAFAVLLPIIYCLSAVCFTYIMPHQYPVKQVLLGINYYRIPGHYHFMMFFIPAVVAATVILSVKIKIKIDSILLFAAQYSAILLSFLLVNFTYDDLKFRLINYDYLLRHKCYNNIIHQSQKHQPETDFERVCINFSLAQKGILAERMFDYAQSGCGGLLSDAVLDNMSCLPSMEACFYLGMTNTALQFAFDSQEAIMNNRKSGRLLKRMAECFIVNGGYEAAKHYLSILSHSLYYSDWAEENLKAIDSGNESGLDSMCLTLRQLRFKEDFIFYYPELPKMLGKLYTEDRTNTLARQYFYASMLLKRDLQSFVSFYLGLKEPTANLPKSFQQAWAMVWSGTHSDFSEIPVELSSETKQQLMEVAKHYMSDRNADNLLRKHGFNFWTYYFMN